VLREVAWESAAQTGSGVEEAGCRRARAVSCLSLPFCLKQHVPQDVLPLLT